jgi:hypothetical protein
MRLQFDSRRARVLLCAALSIGCSRSLDNLPDLASCGTELDVRPFAQTRDRRFLGKVTDATARCRGGGNALAGRDVPWADWQNYWATGNESSKAWWATKNVRGVNGALVDLEYARVELIRFNLFDNSGTYPAYAGIGGPVIKTWPAMRLPLGHPNFRDVGGSGEQLCKGQLIRARTLTGICNDIRNPLMGSTGTLFARNVEFESTFPELGIDSIARNRHGGRTSLLIPDPQVISRKLFTRAQSDSSACSDGFGKPGFAGRELRLSKGAVLQCARCVLDSVHDARLVLALGGREEPFDIHGRRMCVAESRERRAAAFPSRSDEVGLPT